MTRDPWRHRLLVTAYLLAATLVPVAALAQTPGVKTVPWVASNPLIPHDSWSGKQVTLKGTPDVQGASILYTWDFGDGSPAASRASPFRCCSAPRSTACSARQARA